MTKQDFINDVLVSLRPVPPLRTAAKRLIDLELRKAAKTSTCWDRHVGAIVVSLRSEDWGMTSQCTPAILASSCNISCDEPKCRKFSGKQCTALHAEVAALKKYADTWRNMEGAMPSQAALIVSYPPCEACLKRAVADGINTVVHWPLEPQTELIDALMLVRAYHERLGYPALPCNTEDKYRQAREIMLAMSQEVAELTDSMQWKPWRAARNYAHHNMLEESADILFFMDSLFMLFGISWADLAQAIADKVEVTDNRIKEGYHS